MRRFHQGADIADADGPGYFVGNFGRISSQQNRGQAHRMKLSDRGGGIRLDGIGNGDGAEQFNAMFMSKSHVNERVCPRRSVELGDGAALLDQLAVADENRPAVNLRNDAQARLGVER